MPVVLLFLLFVWKVLGAGDIKLFSIVGGFFGAAFLFHFILASFCLGAVISVSQMLYYHILQERILFFIHYVNNSIREKTIRPYYSEKEQGRECVIHFSLAILGGFVYCLRVYL